MIISTLILSVVFTGSTAWEDVTVDEAKQIAAAFLVSVGESSQPVFKRSLDSKAKVPEWEIVYESAGTEYVCSVYKTSGMLHAMVSSLAFPWEEGKDRTGELAFLTEALARRHMLDIMGMLQIPHRLTLDEFVYSQDTELPGGQIKSGRVYGRFYVRVGGFRFVDRTVGVSVLLDSQSGRMISYSSTVDMVVPSARVREGSTRSSAEARLLARGRNVSGYLSEKGWYVPDGETTARLGWRFMKDNISPSAHIVDIHSQDVYQVRGRKTVRIPD